MGYQASRSRVRWQEYSDTVRRLPCCAIKTTPNPHRSTYTDSSTHCSGIRSSSQIRLSRKLAKSHRWSQDASGQWRELWLEQHQCWLNGFTRSGASFSVSSQSPLLWAMYSDAYHDTIDGKTSPMSCSQSQKPPFLSSLSHLAIYWHHLLLPALKLGPFSILSLKSTRLVSIRNSVHIIKPIRT